MWVFFKFDFLQKKRTNMQDLENGTEKKTWFKRLGIAGILFFTIKGCITLS